MNTLTPAKAKSTLDQGARPKLSEGVRSIAHTAEYRDYPIEVLEKAYRECEAAIAPAGAKVTAVLLDRLFAVLPMPNSDGLSIWIELLSEHPTWALKEAIDDCIREHKWNNPPTIADIDSRVRENWYVGHMLEAYMPLRKKMNELKARHEQPQALARAG